MKTYCANITGITDITILCTNSLFIYGFSVCKQKRECLKLYCSIKCFIVGIRSKTLTLLSAKRMAVPVIKSHYRK